MKRKRQTRSDKKEQPMNSQQQYRCWTQSQELYLDHLIQTSSFVDDLHLTSHEKRAVEEHVNMMTNNKLPIQPMPNKPVGVDLTQRDKGSKLIALQNKELEEAMLLDQLNSSCQISKSTEAAQSEIETYKRQIETLEHEKAEITAVLKKFEERYDTHLDDIMEVLVQLDPTNFQGRHGALKGIPRNIAITSHCQNLKVNPTHVYDDRGIEVAALSRLFNALQLLGALRVLNQLEKIDVCTLARISLSILEKIHPSVIKKCNQETLESLQSFLGKQDVECLKSMHPETLKEIHPSLFVKLNSDN